MIFGELAEIWINDYKPKISGTTKAMYKAILAQKEQEAIAALNKHLNNQDNGEKPNAVEIQ